MLPNSQGFIPSLSRYIRTKSKKLLETLLIAAASAFAGFTTIFFMDDCHPTGINSTPVDYTRLWCEKGKYSAAADLFFSTPEKSMHSLFHSTMNSFHPLTLIVFTVEYYLLTLWTAGIWVPCGIFIPLLLTGAAWGRLFGIGVEYMFPHLVGGL